MKRSAKIWLAVLLLLAVFCAVLVKHWKAGEPRRQSIKVLAALEANLHAAQSPAILELLLVPPAIQSRTPLEQIEFLRKALQDEISPEGIRALRRNGRFGSLKELFPAEAGAWATLAGVNPDDCIAFKLEQKGVSAEVVFVREGQSYRIVRCNNVKQMAMAAASAQPICNLKSPILIALLEVRA